MDAVELARLQFAFTIMFHFLFIPMSLGLTLILVVAEGRYYRSRLPQDKAISTFWTRLVAVFFAVGVATGLPMEFAFGTNWGRFSGVTGSVFGIPVAAENLFAFFLESTFLGVLLFGRRRLAPGFYWLSAWLVFLGATLSALFITMANSWQHTPAGYEMRDGKIVLTDFFAALFNPSSMQRVSHTLVATFTAGAFLATGICAYYLARRRHLDFARKAIVPTLLIGLVTSAAMPLLGHWHATEVAAHQPTKMAAFEGLFQTERGARLTLAGWVDEDDRATHAIAIPNLLSILLDFDPNAEVQGLDATPPSDWPHLQAVFQTYHVMVAVGLLMVAVTGVAAFLLWRRKLFESRWALWMLVAAIPLPTVATEAGWVATEMGRQPWIVQGLMRTSEGVSEPVSASAIAATLSVFGFVYAVLLVVVAIILVRVIRRGPEVLETAGPGAGATREREEP